jgi:hypothetical protein
VEEDMPPRRPRRKAAIEATARFGAEARGNRRYQARRQNQEHTPSVDVVSDKPEEEPAEEHEEEEEEEDPQMKDEEGHSQGKEEPAGERQNEGEASTAPVPEKVRVNFRLPFVHHVPACLLVRAIVPSRCHPPR